MKPIRILLVAVIAFAATLSLVMVKAQKKKLPEADCGRTAGLGYDDTPMLPDQPWRVHDIKRPQPRTIAPGTESSQQSPGRAPSDAVVLFDGKDLSQWTNHPKKKDLGNITWKVENGYVEVVPYAGDLVSKEKFGDAQYHIEWAAPAKPCGTSQWRGNSGVLIMSNYEIQVLDNDHNPTYADGMAGSIYGQWPPLVNPARARGEWQMYDIAFEAPVFEGEKLVKPAYVTVFLNGVLVQHHQKIIGRMTHRQVAQYRPHGATEPLSLQDHEVPVRYRNIWVRPLRGYDQP
jgi:hypothetical protein